MKRIVPLLLVVAACQPPRTYSPAVARMDVVVAPAAKAEVKAQVEVQLAVETHTETARGAGWLTDVPEQWIASANDDGTIQLEGAEGAIVAARGAGDCNQFSYPPPVGELDYGDLDVHASRPWDPKIGYVVERGTDVYCRDLGDGQVMVLVVPSGVVDPTEVLGSVQPLA